MAHKRMLKIEGERIRSRQEDVSKPKKRELEKVLREEALSKPVPETSKGFALMAKMGFKPGMSLGKKKDESDLGSGIKEPIPLEVKNARTGLGHDSERENQAKERLMRNMEMMKRRADQTVELIDDYRKRKRGMSNTKDLIRDILTSRKICVELDTRYCYANGKDAPQEVRFDELPDEELCERLKEITGYLRSTHFYCIWCGCQFEHLEELEGYCPGLDRQAHDSTDD
ncbi:g-patch domain protein [Ancylostoma ceylanicum]|uniref:G patch domain-containing protein 11 n=1 Tax=Ancylostoma ceylanicum TaxID=53326 RepID=A0A0D6M521_9BILA|nr:g-patch domain protein [Ancylostoma ceylanicum]